jgi:glutamate N-acetyltransferase/amino-acid N-acetyltransferase
MKIIEGGVTAAKGFEAAGVEAQIKYANRKDMALVYSKEPCESAGVFTSNIVKASPVMWDKKVVAADYKAHAIVANAGIANACTGEQGDTYCEEMAAVTAKGLGIKTNQVLVASTGVIGRQLPIEKIVSGVEGLVKEKNNDLQSGNDAASAIMTTDTISKEVAVTFEIDGMEVTIGGMCKGSGMIHPNMCTMLAFVTTDLNISKELLQEALKTDVQDTYNMVSVDGDMSTNDTLLILANGLAGNKKIEEKDENYDKFLEALHYINETLAKKMAGDGEGATALFETKVIRAKSKEDAKKLSKAVICSSLTKAAIFGHDANWGRILCALGYSGVEFDPNKIELFMQSNNHIISIFKDGTAQDYSEDAATKILSAKEVTVLVDMHDGNAEATAWGCDLTYDYVRINADYRT